MRRSHETDELQNLNRLNKSFKQIIHLHNVSNLVDICFISDNFIIHLAIMFRTCLILKLAALSILYKFLGCTETYPTVGNPRESDQHFRFQFPD